MADETKNVIGIAMELDVADLKAGLQETGKQIKTANKEFAAATSGMEDWSKSSDGLNAKLSQLATVLSLQKKNLAGYEAELEETTKKHGENSEQVRILKDKILDAKAAIGKTEKQQRKYSAALDEVRSAEQKNQKEETDLKKKIEQTTDATKKSTKEFDSNKKSSEKLNKGLAGLGKGFTIVKGTIAGLLTKGISDYIKGIAASVEQSREFRKELGMLEATAITTGNSFEGAKENLLEVASITEDTGAATEGMNNLLTAGFDDSELDNVTDALVGASIKWKDTLKFEGMADGLQETLATGSAIGPFAELLDRAGASTDDFNAGLAACTTEAEKQQFVVSQLAKLGLSEVKQEYEEANGSLIDYNRAVLDNQTAMAAIGEVIQPFQTMLIKLKTKGIEAMIPTIQRFGEIAHKAFGGDLAGAGEDVMTFFSEISGKVTKLISTLAAKIPELAPKITDALGNFVKGYIGRITEFFPIILNGITALIQSIATALPGLLEQIIASLQALFPKMLDSVMSMLDGIVDVLPGLINTIVSALPGLIDAIIGFLSSALPKILDAAVKLFSAILDALPGVVDNIVDALPKLITSIVDFISGAIPQIIDAGIKLLTALVEALPKIISTIVKALPQIINSIITALMKALPQIIDAGLKLLTALIGALPKIISTIVKALPQIINGIVNGLISAVPDIIMAGVQLFVALVQNLPAIIAGVVKAIPEIIGSIVSAFGDAKSDMSDAGLNLIKGLWQGISDAASWLKNKLSGFVNDTTAHIKKFFGIKSPSKLMRDQVGANIAKGIGVGIAKETKSVTGEMTALGKKVTKLGEKTMSGFTRGMKSGSSGALKYLDGFADKVNAIKGGLAASVPVKAVATAGGKSTAGVNTVNNTFNQTINAPKQPSRIELYRQTKNLLALKGV